MNQIAASPPQPHPQAHAQYQHEQIARPAEAIAPSRDYNKRDNSLDRDLLPAGYFPGTSKKTYDALYLRTRGAIRPSRTVQAKKRQIMEWAGIQNEKTVESHLRHLRSVGLIVRHGSNGDNEGFVYQVLTPGELGLTSTPAQAQPHPQAQPTPGQNMGLGAGQNMAGGGLGQSVKSQAVAGDAKTSNLRHDLKDDDVSAFAGMNRVLAEASERLTGRPPSRADADRWREIGELLVSELRIISSRTQISSAPAVLATHLMRRLRKRDAQQIEREAREAGATGDERAAGAAKPHLSPAEMQERVNTMVELMSGGRSVESLDEEFAAGFRPVQWHQIRSMALAQFSATGGASPPTEA